MAGKIIKPNVIIKKKGAFYYIDKDGNLCETQQHKGGAIGRKFKKNK